jgi:hypothetical protein
VKVTAATLYELMLANFTLESLGSHTKAIPLIILELEKFRNSVLKEAEEVARIYDAPEIAAKIEQIERVV